MEPKSYQKIKVAIHLQSNDPHTNDLKIMEWLTNYQIYFIDKFYQSIVGTIGEDGWAVRFIHRTQLPDQLVVDIHVHEKEDYMLICQVIKKDKEQFSYSFYRKALSDF